MVVTKHKILLVDDDEDDAVLFKALIKKIPDNSFEIEWVKTYKEATQLIEKDEHDVYVIDYMLGAHSGLDILNAFKVSEMRQPFIMLTGAANGTVEKEAVRLGAADYLVKGTYDEQLLSRVLYYSIQRKLMEAQRIEHLLEINRSKDEFIALASHELRTPATAAKQYIGMLTDGFAGELTPPQQNFLERASENVERQLLIIDDILRVARMDLDKLSLNSVEVDIAQVLHAVIKDITPLIKKRGQYISFTIPNELLIVMGEELYIRMALTNIVENASKYSFEGGKIQVELSKDNHNVMIKVTDNGVGIDKKDVDKLFVKFSRIHNALSIERGGTGLGLYWSREVVRLHAGDISVSSQPNKLTTFTICLPLASTNVVSKVSG